MLSRGMRGGARGRAGEGGEWDGAKGSYSTDLQPSHNFVTERLPLLELISYYTTTKIRTPYTLPRFYELAHSIQEVVVRPPVYLRPPSVRRKCGMDTN